MSPLKLRKIPARKLAFCIKPSGYYNIKSQRLKEFLRFFFGRYRASLKAMAAQETARLRSDLLSVKGIGEETADSMLLYALRRPVFVIDAYTKRFLSRHKFVKEGATYGEAQNLFMRNLKPSVVLFNEYHALFVRLGKEFCLKRRPKCEGCPLKEV